MLGIYGIPICACGKCSEYVKWSEQHKQWNTYLLHHNRRGKKSGPAWNIGLTKDDDERVRKQGNPGNPGRIVSQETRDIISVINKKNPTRGMLGKKHSKETRKQMSASAKGRVPHNKGKKSSQATKDKIAKANIGKKQSEETKRKRSVTLMGHEVTQETRDKISVKHIGHEVSQETRIIISCSLRGIEREEWTGFVDDLYPREFNETLKKFIRARDNYVCQNPNCEEHDDPYDRELDVHHIDYDKFNCELWDLIALCRKCHSETLGNRDYWQAFYENIMEERFGRNKGI